MAELAMIYAAFCLLAAPTTFPMDHDGFMPFQNNYWLWKCIGFGGLGVFQLRWIVQWIYSEAHKESRVPVIFWWLSLTGSLMELCYFLRQQDSVGVAGCLGGITYIRNLMFVYQKRRRDREALLGDFPVTNDK